MRPIFLLVSFLAIALACTEDSAAARSDATVDAARDAGVADAGALAVDAGLDAGLGLDAADGG